MAKPPGSVTVRSKTRKPGGPTQLHGSVSGNNGSGDRGWSRVLTHPSTRHDPVARKKKARRSKAARLGVKLKDLP